MTLEIDLFRTRDHVADFDRHVADYKAQSAQTRSRLQNRFDLRYGATARATLDLFFPAEVQSAPIHLFIHGGYWRMFDKSDFSFIAETVCAAGGIAAIMDYDLMPDVRMDTIVDQVRTCARWLSENARSFGGDPSRFTVSGHSAGGHLACFVLTNDSPVQLNGALLVSGIYDLEPLRTSFLQPELQFTHDDVARFSPIGLKYGGLRGVTLMVGADETPPFHQQAVALQKTLKDSGTKTDVVNVGGANHMSIVSDLGRRNTGPARALRSLIDFTIQSTAESG